QVLTRFDEVNYDSYRVYPRPVQSPDHTTPAPPLDGRVTVVNPADSTASPFGWHDTDGVAGPEFTTLRGNNVHAYADPAADNLPPAVEPACGPGLACVFPLDLTMGPGTYTSAAIENLFYWNNIVHDVLVHYGFDSPSGNFQVNTYGAGGLGNDEVQAEGQDGAGFNNANFFTPVDGLRPRMQMFLATSTTPMRDG